MSVIKNTTNRIAKVFLEKPAGLAKKYLDYRQQKKTEKTNRRIIKRMKRKQRDRDRILRNSPTIFYRERLWGGYSMIAIAELEKIFNDVDVDSHYRADAAANLAYWKFYEKDYLASYDYISASNSLDPSFDLKRQMTEIQVLIKLGRNKDADGKIKNARHIYPGRPDWDVLEAVTAKRIVLESGGLRSDAESQQMYFLNKTFQAAGLAPVFLKNPEKSPAFDNLDSNPPEMKADHDLPLISIIMPAYNAEKTISFSIESVLKQTYKNIELIVVDDNSSDGTINVVTEYEKNDPRVKLIRKSVNQGAYMARNEGLKESCGVFVTIHDSDDWNHPQKIEKGYEMIRSRPGAVASILYHLMVDENLEYVTNWRPGKNLFKIDTSSLLFVREITAIIGCWDNVRIGADTYFYYKIQAYYGAESVVKGGAQHPYMLCFGRENSLTRNPSTHISTIDFGLRQQYRSAYSFLCDRKWFKLKKQVLVPIGNRVVKKNKAYDWVVFFDFTKQDIHLHNICDLMRHASESGLVLAAMVWHGFEQNTLKKPADMFYDLCVECDVDLVAIGDSIDTKSAIIGCSGLLQHRLDYFPEVKAENVYVICKNDKSSVDAYESHVSDLFGFSAKWLEFDADEVAMFSKIKNS